MVVGDNPALTSLAGLANLRTVGADGWGDLILANNPALRDLPPKVKGGRAGSAAGWRERGGGGCASQPPQQPGLAARWGLVDGQHQRAWLAPGGEALGRSAWHLPVHPPHAVLPAPPCPVAPSPCCVQVTGIGGYVKVTGTAIPEADVQALDGRANHVAPGGTNPGKQVSTGRRWEQGPGTRGAQRSEVGAPSTDCLCSCMSALCAMPPFALQSAAAAHGTPPPAFPQSPANPPPVPRRALPP